MLVDLCVRQYLRGLPALRRGRREPAVLHVPGVRSFRALRPASAKLFPTRPKRQELSDERLSGTRSDGGYGFGQSGRVDSAIRWRRFARQLCIPVCAGAAELLRDIQSSDCYETPAAGYRNRETGALGGIGTEGNYRSSSTAASGSVSAGNLNFTAGNVNPLNGWYRANAYSVRCVQHLPLEAVRLGERPDGQDPEWRRSRLLSARSQIPQSAGRAVRRRPAVHPRLSRGDLGKNSSGRSIQRLPENRVLRATATVRRESWRASARPATTGLRRRGLPARSTQPTWTSTRAT